MPRRPSTDLPRLALPWLALSTLAAALLAIAPAKAEEARAPAEDFALEGSLRSRLFLDILGRRGDRKAHADGYTKTELGLTLSMPAGLALAAVFKLEPTGRERGAADRAFNDHAGWVEELTLSWREGPLELFAGKIHPRLGFAWNRGPGIYGEEFGERYELSEKLGGGASLSWPELLGLGEGIGTHDLRIEGFTADRSFLSSSVLSRRWAVADPGTGAVRWSRRNLRAAGGADNTDPLGGWVASAEGQELPLPLGSLAYALGLSWRRPGEDARLSGPTAAERGTVAGLAWEVPLTTAVTATPIAEWLRLDQADGRRGTRRDLVTAGMAVARAPFSLAYAHGWQRDRGGDAPGDAAQHSASVTYDLGDAAPWLSGFGWSLGWRRLREAGTAANDFGTQLAYRASF